MQGLRIEDIKNAQPKECTGSFTDFQGERFYKIEHYEALPPFFMTIVSSSDIWNYIWSTGALTAGRKNSDRAVFPYYTADKVLDGKNTTGPVTAIKVKLNGQVWLWEPFSETGRELWRTKNTLYKNLSGSKLYFEEQNLDLGLTFQYGWTSSDTFGLIKHSIIQNDRDDKAEIEILDGARNIMSACTTSAFQNDNSVLLDAYKRTDIETDSGLAVFSVTSIVTDKAEPSEGLFANVSWFSCKGELGLSREFLAAFRSGSALHAETILKGQRPGFFAVQKMELGKKESRDWYQAFDTSLDASAIASLKLKIADRSAARRSLETDIHAGLDLLTSMLANADGLQKTADETACAHHEANVLFNCMRGGIFSQDYDIPVADFSAFVQERNRSIGAIARKMAERMKETVHYTDLRNAVKETRNPQLERLFLEYLPLTFSRRHGDPSRPWNRFSIELKNEKGERALNYQGNWRDIFQNWEALAVSWPLFLENITAKFLNATTADGFNPYRITREGIDWEVQEHDNPWSNIGYWGDHQIIYLAKLLEAQYRFDREGLKANLERGRFSSANVPYRIKSYGEITKNPRSTIVFDEKIHMNILKACETEGSDAKLIHAPTGEVALVSMTTKLLSLICAKMANLVPGGGVWLNTQRPEWNDANNALAGYGLSMVTTYYLRRFLAFLIGLYEQSTEHSFPVTEETATFFTALADHFAALKGDGVSEPDAAGDPKRLRSFMDVSGELFQKQRESLYSAGYGPETAVERDRVLSGLRAFLSGIDRTIEKNRRKDGLYHSYNTLNLNANGGMSVHSLQEMLEGQVAVLSSGILSGKETLDLCKTLKKSALFREDQYSYILYPDKELPRFTEKNNVNATEALSIPLIAALKTKGNPSLFRVDEAGTGHFNPSFRNVKDLENSLLKLEADKAISKAERERDAQAIFALYEKTFNHRSFTGRSGTFYAYEGLGSIYWHMVAKLMLAVQEYALVEQNPEIAKELARAYYDIRKGIGYNKTPREYGAFPTDPYSHTPAGQGAKQPGMTGQVKEEILTRWGELGVTVQDGSVTFMPSLLRPTEFSDTGTLSFTWCGVPIEYSRAFSKDVETVETAYQDGTVEKTRGTTLGGEIARKLFSRQGNISRIDVKTTAGHLVD